MILTYVLFSFLREFDFSLKVRTWKPHDYSLLHWFLSDSMNRLYPIITQGWRGDNLLLCLKPDPFHGCGHSGL